MSLEPWTVCSWRPLWVTTTAHSTPTIGHPCRCKIHIIEQSLEEEKRESTNHSLSQIPPVHNRTLGHWIGHPRLDIVVLQHFGEFLFHYFGQFHYFTSFTGDIIAMHCSSSENVQQCAFPAASLAPSLLISSNDLNFHFNLWRYNVILSSGFCHGYSAPQWKHAFKNDIFRTRACDTSVIAIALVCEMEALTNCWWHFVQRHEHSKSRIGWLKSGRSLLQ